MKYLVCLILSAIGLAYVPCRAQAQLDTCIERLRSANFDVVFKARNTMLLNYQKEAIPKLILLLKDTGYVKLTNTADMIYPGAKAFYGHGWIVNYDIDWISVRAAWVLEEITYQDFGYLPQRLIDEKTLLAIHQKDYKNYLKKGYHDINYHDTTVKGRLITYRLMLASRASAWWHSHKAKWSRITALQDALASHNEHREALALEYLRFGNDFEPKDAAAVRRSYYPIVKPLVIQIKNSNDSESDQAGYLLEEMKEGNGK